MTVFETKNIRIISPSDLTNNQIRVIEINQHPIEPEKTDVPSKIVVDSQAQPIKSESMNQKDIPVLNEVVLQDNNKSLISKDEKGLEQVLIQDEKVQNYIKVGNLEEASKANEELPYETQKDNYCSIARAYFQQDNSEKAIKILDKYVIKSGITDPIYEEFALHCCRKAKYAESIKFINKIYGGPTLKSKIFVTVAEEYYQKKDFENALQTISHLKNSNNDNFEDFHLKIGRDYIEQGKLDEAGSALSRIIYKESSALLTILAKKYYERKDLKNALIYNQVNKDYEAKKIFYIQIAQDYQKEGHHAEAIDVLRQICSHGYLVDSKYSAICKDYIDNNNFDKALECITLSSIRKTAW